MSLTETNETSVKNISGCVFIENEKLDEFPLTRQRSSELPKHNTFRLIHNNEIVGYALYRRARNNLNILSFEILPQYRRQGHGKEFFALLEKTAKKYRSNNLVVVVDAESVDGKNFFISCGMQEFDNHSPHVLVKKVAA